MSNPSKHLRVFLVIVTLVLLTTKAAFSQQEEMRGAPAEPSDASEVRRQTTVVEKLLPNFPDRGAALYFLAASKQHLGETLEAM